MADIERVSVKDLINDLSKYSDNAIVELSISVLWCDNYGGGTAWLKVIDGKTEVKLMEVEE